MATTPCCVSFGWVEEDREVKLLKKNGVWMTAHFNKGQPARKISESYGSHELPTPWPDTVDRETVLRELTVRNPHAKIIG